MYYLFFCFFYPHISTIAGISILMAEPNTEPSQCRLIRSLTILKECHKLVEGGFIYNKQRVIANVTHCQCEKTRVCKAKIDTKLSEIVKSIGEHLHSPDILAVNCFEVKDIMKHKARQGHNTTYHILGEELEIIFSPTAAKLPNLDSIKRTIRRERHVRDIAPVRLKIFNSHFHPIPTGFLWDFPQDSHRNSHRNSHRISHRISDRISHRIAIGIPRISQRISLRISISIPIGISTGFPIIFPMIPISIPFPFPQQP